MLEIGAQGRSHASPKVIREEFAEKICLPKQEFHRNLIPGINSGCFICIARFTLSDTCSACVNLLLSGSSAVKQDLCTLAWAGRITNKIFGQPPTELHQHKPGLSLRHAVKKAAVARRFGPGAREVVCPLQIETGRGGRLVPK